MEKLDPVSFIVGIVVHGIILGIILAIAFPIKNLIDKGARYTTLKTKEAFRPTIRIEEFGGNK